MHFQPKQMISYDTFSSSRHNRTLEDQLVAQASTECLWVSTQHVVDAIDGQCQYPCGVYMSDSYTLKVPECPFGYTCYSGLEAL